MVKKTVEIVVFNFELSCLFSDTYLTTPFSNPNVPNASTELTKFLKFPTRAIPLGPTKSAITLEVTKPIAILIITLTLFKEVTLNNEEFIIFLIEFN